MPLCIWSLSITTLFVKGILENEMMISIISPAASVVVAGPSVLEQVSNHDLGKRH